MARAYLGLGANLGDPAAQIDEAIDAARRPSRDRRHRPLARDRHQGLGQDRPARFHQCASSRSRPVWPEALLDACLDIETEMGRVRGENWGPRLIDIDIIAYDRLVLRIRTA